MTREGHSLSHESPSYKVHDHPHTSIYRYTYTMYNAITQSRKVKQALPTFQGYGPTGYRKCKIDICSIICFIAFHSMLLLPIMSLCFFLACFFTYAMIYHFVLGYV